MASIESDETVRPASPSGGGEWVLTGLDRANLLLTIRGTWVFERELEPARLRDGLSRLLSLYPHLAGRMVRKGEAVALNDAGVPFTVASSPELTVLEVCSDPGLAGRLSNPLSTPDVKKGRAAPVTVRLTRLSDGCVLSVRCCHGCADGASFYGMVRAWGQLCSGTGCEAPVLDQSLLPAAPDRPRATVLADAADLGWKRLSLWAVAGILPAFALGRLNQRSEAIRFGPEALRRLRDEAALESGLRDLTTNLALSAHLSRLCALLHDLPVGTRCQQITVLDGRERLPGVPSRFVGNAAWVVRSAEFAAGATLGGIAAETHERLAPFLQTPSEPLLRQVVLGLELMRQRTMVLPYDLAAMHGRRPTTIYVNSFARMPVYDVDFGDGGQPVLPVRVIPHDLPDPVLIWPAPPAEGGVEVYLTGRQAQALRKRPPGDPWWQEMLRFGAEAPV